MSQKEECDELFNDMMNAVHYLLNKNKEFYPIGSVMLFDGKVELTAIETDSEHPLSNEVIEQLTQLHHEKALMGQIKASAIAYNASVKVENVDMDAIIVSVEHREGYSVQVVVPYKQTIFNKIKYGQIFAQEGLHEVFNEA